MTAPSTTTPTLTAFAEEVGLIADRVDNLIHAEVLPLPAHIAKQARVATMTALRDDLRKLVVHYSGTDPWSDE